MIDNRLDDYVDVAERIGLFYDKYPEGRLGCEFRLEQLDGSTFLIATAYAYTTPDDPRPGTGTAQELIPGRTAFTRGSEYQNAETSAWGRAIASLGIATKRGIATKQEVASAQQRRHELTMGKPKGKIERISHSDQTVVDDPWQGPAPIDPETGEAAELGSSAAEAVAVELLGASPITADGLDNGRALPVSESRPDRSMMHKYPATEKQLNWARKLITAKAEEVELDPLEYLNAYLHDIGFPEVEAWEGLGKNAASRIIEGLK